MAVSWNKKYNPVQIVSKIESARKAGSDGDGKEVKFAGWGFHEYAALVYSMLDFSNDIPEADARALVTKAIFDAGAKGEITTKSLISEVNKLERKYQLLPIEKYVLATSISINSSLKLKPIRNGNTTIVFESSSPVKFQEEISTLAKNAEDRLFAALPRNYLCVRVYTSAKSIYHAADQALDALDYIRGLWNLQLNRRHSTRMTFGGKPKPVNNIILGPLHTLHKPSGELAVRDFWWYEPNYLGAITPYSFEPSELASMYETLNHVKRLFKTHKYSEVIQNALTRYARALDERNWGVAFIKLWSILELLTDSGRGNYDTTIERIAFLYKEPDYHTQVLQHLREYRNSSVHLDKSNNETETYLYQIKNYVGTLINFHLSNKYKFASIQDAAGFLSLPYEDETLKGQINKRVLARKFRGYK